MSITGFQPRTDNPDPAPVPVRPPWEQLEPAPRAAGRALIAERLFRYAVRDLPVRIALAGGERLGAGGPGSPLMRIERPRAFFHRLGVHGKIGFGEAYMAGDWSSPEPADLLTPFAGRIAQLIPRPLQTLRGRIDVRQPDTDRNTTTGARRNIQRHYDLSNDFFATFLDPTMTYSGAPMAPGDDLTAAQLRKLDAVLDCAGVRTGTRLLETGTGWGSLAIRAAQRGAHVTTLTLSAEQHKLASDRVAAAGLTDLVDVQLRDYRHADGRYDAVVSVEMIEAVGAEYWPTYFHTVNRLLVDGGRAGIQAITMPHDRLLATRSSYTWIHKYIFPGGLLPSVQAIERNIQVNTDMTLTDRYSFGAGYAETLRRWRHRFIEHWGEIAALGFGDLLYRMWEFYLAYSEAGFRSGYLDVWQFGCRKTGNR